MIKIKTGRASATKYSDGSVSWPVDGESNLQNSEYGKSLAVRVVTEADWRKIQRVVRAAEVFVTGYENGRMAFRKDSEAALVKSVAALRGEKHGK